MNGRYEQSEPAEHFIIHRKFIYLFLKENYSIETYVIIGSDKMFVHQKILF